MLGDKMETAINIGHSCRILTEDMHVIQIGEADTRATMEILALGHEALKADGGKTPFGIVVEGRRKQDRGGAGGLEAEHPREGPDPPLATVVVEAGPVGADVPRVPDRDREDLGGTAEIVADLEGAGLLALEPVRVDRVHDGDRVVVLLAEGADDVERLVEVPVDRDDPRADDERLEELAEGDLPLREDDDDLEARRRAVRGRGGRGVAGRGADDRLRALLDRLADGGVRSELARAHVPHRKPPVLLGPAASKTAVWRSPAGTRIVKV